MTFRKYFDAQIGDRCILQILAIFPLILSIAAGIWVSSTLVEFSPKDVREAEWFPPLVTLAITSTMALSAYVIVISVIGRIDVSWIGWKKLGCQFLLGMTIPWGALYISNFLSCLFRSSHSYIPDFGQASIVILLSGSLWAVCEELIFRGMILRLSMRWMSPISSLLLSSFVFTAMHLINPTLYHGTPIPTTLAYLAFHIFPGGLLLGSAYLATGRLVFPIAVHASWNWAAVTVDTEYWIQGIIVCLIAGSVFMSRDEFRGIVPGIRTRRMSKFKENPTK